MSLVCGLVCGSDTCDSQKTAVSRSRNPLHKLVKRLSPSVFQIKQNPGNSNSDNSNSPANSNLVPFPLDLIPLFSHFYSVNSNSDNSNSPANSNLVPFPLDLIPLFSHFYSVNSNSDNSTPPLTRTKGRYVFSWGGRAGEFWHFFPRKVLALPCVLIKKLLTPPPHL